jgi:hypothetical protein
MTHGSMKDTKNVLDQRKQAKLNWLEHSGKKSIYSVQYNMWSQQTFQDQKDQIH